MNYERLWRLPPPWEGFASSPHMNDGGFRVPSQTLPFPVRLDGFWLESNQLLSESRSRYSAMAPDSAHVVLQVKDFLRTEYDVSVNGKLIGQLRLIDGEWRSLVPGDFGKAANLTEGTNLLLLQYYTQFN